MATRRWLGIAADKIQKVTITVSGTWSTNDTITVTINNVDFVITIGTLVTTDQVATTLKQAFNGETLTDTSASYSPNLTNGAQDIGMFAEIEASVSSSVVTFSAREAGKPFTMTSSETAGSGSISQSTTVSCTGRRFFSDQDNWSGNAVPVNGDDIVFDAGDVDCLFGLSTGIQPGSVTITRGYSGRIGLPDINVGPNGVEGGTDLSFYEYRTKKLTFNNNSTTCTYTVGQRDGVGSGRIRIDAGAGQSTVVVWSTGTRAEQNAPSFEFTGTHASNSVTVLDGDAGIAYLAGDSTNVSALRVGSDPSSNATVVVGADATLTTVTQSGGSLTISASCTTMNMHGGICRQLAGAPATLNCLAGEYIDQSTTTIGSGCTIGSNGFYNRGHDNRAKTITPAVDLYRGSKFHDPSKSLTLTGGFVTNGCGIEDVELRLGAARTYTVT